MSDPISGGAGGAAKMALQQLQQMQQQMQQTPTQPGGGDSAFAQKMQTQQVNQSQQVQQVQDTQKISQDIRPQGIRPGHLQPSQQTQQTQRVQGTQQAQSAQFQKSNGTQSTNGMGEGLARFFHRVDSRKTNLDKLLQDVMKGKSLGNKDMLVLQYKVSQFSLEMDLTSKVVDKTAGGIKQAMNTQV